MKPKILGMGQIYNITCDQTLIPEFPALLFGEHEDGSLYFDATKYLPRDPNSQKTVEDFFQQFNFQIKALSECYKIPESSLVLINSDGHQLVVGCLCFLFLSYVDISFNVYMFERMDEMFSKGWTISDSCLAEAIQQRLTPDICQEIFRRGNKSV